MNTMLGDCPDVFVLVYLGNILVYLAMAEDHTKHIKAVFKLLAKSKFDLKCKKFVLFLLGVALFGHVFYEHGVLLLPGKVSAM